MHAFWEIVISNCLVVAVLGAGVALLGRYWKNPAGQHLLWVLVLLKLVTPPVVTVRVPWAVYGPFVTAGAQEPGEYVRDRSSVRVSRHERVAPIAVSRQGQRPPQERAAWGSLNSPILSPACS
jgi:hypothetical protein